MPKGPESGRAVNLNSGSLQQTRQNRKNELTQSGGEKKERLVYAHVKKSLGQKS